MAKIRLFFSIVSLLFIFCINSGFCRAEEISLGIFSATAAQNKFSQNLTLKIKDASFTLSGDDIQKLIVQKEDLFYNPKHLSEIENINFCQYKKLPVCELLFPIAKESHIQKIVYAALDSEKLKQYLNDLARQVNKEPDDAKLQMENGKVSVFSLSGNGLELDVEKSTEIITDYFKNNQKVDFLELAYVDKKPEVNIDSIDNLGITSLIGEGRSNFRGSPKNRIFNIKVATNRFNGVLIKPGEEFSFTTILGEVDGDHGYLPELVIKKDKTEPEFGGGICQVSTTTFRAAIYSGLKITARRNHAYPVSYYNPQGMDATVYVPRPDLRFINNTPGYILIQTKIEGTELIFDFYGTDDGRKTEVIGPKITERNPDGSMKATFTQKVSDKDGNLILNDVFNSSYDSPSKYPHPGDALTQKPASWSNKEWSTYKKEHPTP